jgi:TIR domain
VSGGIFLAYRREDSASWARHVYDRITNSLGPKSVFFEVSSIELGQDFVEVLTEQISLCDALVAIIGRNWLQAADKDNRRRLDDPDDFVRIEIEAALARNIPVIPVLVDGATMPKTSELPESLKGLARQPGFEISRDKFGVDVEKLMRALGSILQERWRRDATEPAEHRRNERSVRRSPEVGHAEARQTSEARQTAPAAEEQPAARNLQENLAGAERPNEAQPRYYVSYARADGSDPNRERDVDWLCEEARRRGISVLRDKKDLRLGELISDFMRKLGEGDRVFVFLSDKYLKSPYCMFELFELWRNSKQNKSEFLRQVRVFSVDGVRIAESADRLAYTKIWKINRDDLRRVIDDVGWEEAGERAIEEYFRMKTFTSQVCDILAVFADVVQAQTLEDFLNHSFYDPTESVATVRTHYR